MLNNSDFEKHTKEAMRNGRRIFGRIIKFLPTHHRHLFIVMLFRVLQSLVTASRILQQRSRPIIFNHDIGSQKLYHERLCKCFQNFYRFDFKIFGFDETKKNSTHSRHYREILFSNFITGYL